MLYGRAELEKQHFRKQEGAYPEGVSDLTYLFMIQNYAGALK
jgi:hypothetical protein